MEAAVLQLHQQLLRLPADPSQLTVARRFAEEAAARFGLDESGCYQFKLAVSEAVANAIEHGCPYPDGTVGVELFEEPDSLTIEITDCGVFTTNMDEQGSLPERGRGLAFMTVFVDELDILRGEDHTAVRLTKHRPA
jgi:anti-sigma regulatory factor (Ser/Thr protein kinase)